MANQADLFNGSNVAVTATGNSGKAPRSKEKLAAATDTALKTSFLDNGGTVALKASSSIAEEAQAALILMADLVNRVYPGTNWDVSTPDKSRNLLLTLSLDDMEKSFHALRQGQV